MVMSLEVRTVVIAGDGTRTNKIWGMFFSGHAETGSQVLPFPSPKMRASKDG